MTPSFTAMRARDRSALRLRTAGGGPVAADGRRSFPESLPVQSLPEDRRSWRPFMPRLRALVLEDEWPARNYLVQLIEATQLAEVVGAVASVGEAREVLAGLAVDVVFVDVQLCGSENGLDLVESTAGAHPHGPRPRFVS